MTADVKVNVHGAEQLLANLKSLGPKVQRKHARRAARRAMKVVMDDARSAAKAFDDPASPRKIWKEIVTVESSRQSKRAGGVVMRVGVRGGARKGASDVFYWRFLELGTEKMRARPFLRPALEQNSQDVYDKLAAELWNGISQETQSP